MPPSSGLGDAGEEDVLERGRDRRDGGRRDARRRRGGGRAPRPRGLRGAGDGDVQRVAEELGAGDPGQSASRAARAARASAARTSSSAAAEGRGEGARRVEGEQPAVVEEGEAVEALGLVEVGGGDDGGDAAADHLVHDPPEVAARDRVDAEGRLVEQQHARLVDERAGEAELLLHAAGEGAGQPVAERPEVREGEEALDGGAARSARGTR